MIENITFIPVTMHRISISGNIDVENTDRFVT